MLGRDVLLNGRPHTIVGVLSPAIELGNQSEIDLWAPIAVDPALASRSDRQWRTVGRLADGAGLADAHAQVAAIAQRLAREHPDTNRDWTARVGVTREAIAGTNTWLVLSLLFTVVGLLLVLACANIMNLLIARLIGRRQELAVRTALGATRARVVGQIVAESLLIGLAGGALGLAIAAGGLRGVHAVATEPFFRQLALDLRVVGFAFVLAFLAPLVFAIIPTLRVLRLDVRSALNEASARSVGGAVGRPRPLAAGGGAGVAGGDAAGGGRAGRPVDAGIDPRRSRLRPGPAAERRDRDPGLEDRRRGRRAGAAPPAARPRRRHPRGRGRGLRQRPAGAALPAARPRSTSAGRRPSRAIGRRPDWSSPRPATSPCVGVPILAGRGFEPADAGSPAPVAVVSAESARRYWGDPARALGATVRVPAADARPPLEARVIGVARDTANPDIDQAPEPVLYLLDDHRPTRRLQIVLRAAAPASLAPALRAAIRDVDADLPAYQLRTATEGFADENSSNLLLGGLFAAFALVAILLATTGLYGVMSYAVSQRTPEIAVRLALGAPARAIAASVIGRSVGLAAIGAALGLAGALALAQAMRSVLFGVTTTDPPTYLGAAALALAAAVAAAWLPMRRASQVDPIQSLRQV